MSNQKISVLVHCANLDLVDMHPKEIALRDLLTKGFFVEPKDLKLDYTGLDYCFSAEYYVRSI